MAHTRPGSDHQPPFATPEAAEAAFYAAFAATDLKTMAGVWDDGDDTLCIHPGGGLLQGRAAVMQSWMEIFSGARPPTIEVETVTTLVSGDIAVHVRAESIRPNGQPAEQASRILATNVFRRRDGSWRLVAHQASLPLRVRSAQGALDHRVH
jgi:uncharacterized protein (TIGR02246 family)